MTPVLVSPSPHRPPQTPILYIPPQLKPEKFDPQIENRKQEIGNTKSPLRPSSLVHRQSLPLAFRPVLWYNTRLSGTPPEWRKTMTKPSLKFFVLFVIKTIAPLICVNPCLKMNKRVRHSELCVLTPVFCPHPNSKLKTMNYELRTISPPSVLSGLKQAKFDLLTPVS